MKSFVRTVLASAAVATLVACGGGGGSVSTGGTYYTHDQLAQEFVRRVNSDVSGFNLTLVKSTTLQYDYIVVYDQDYGTYDAYYIGNYNVGENLANYLNNYESYFYYDLVPQGDGTYWDPITGTLFQKNTASSKNLAKMKSVKEELSIKKSADSLVATYGLSAEKAEDAARFAFKMKAAPKGTYNVKDYDAFAKELTGSTITDFQTDFKANNVTSLTKRIDTAAQVTGMGTEGVNKLLTDMFAAQK